MHAGGRIAETRRDPVTQIAFLAQVGLPETTVRAAARAAEDGGFESFWVNSPPGADSLALLAWAREATTSIPLGTAVVGVSSTSPASILAGAARLDLPRDRVRLGIGSGFGPHPLQRVRQALRDLRPGGYQLVIGALGPAMCGLGGEAADGVVLSSVTPVHAIRSAALVREGADAAGRGAPPIYTNVIVAFGPGAEERAAAGASFLGGLPQYAAHFARTGLTPADTVLVADGTDSLARVLSKWHETTDAVVITPLLPPDRPELALDALDATRAAWAAG